jgi:hypothetical protein
MLEAVGGLRTGTELFYATRRGWVSSPFGPNCGERGLALNRTGGAAPWHLMRYQRVWR